MRFVTNAVRNECYFCKKAEDTNSNPSNIYNHFKALKKKTIKSKHSSCADLFYNNWIETYLLEYGIYCKGGILSLHGRYNES